VKARRAQCPTCNSFGCEGGEGTYEITAGNEVRLEFSATSCALVYRLTDLSSPPARDVFGASTRALTAARVIVNDAAFASATALRYTLGVACDADFQTCTFPAFP
jgi:hypothetical protein